MTGAQWAQLVLMFGPKAFELIERLISVWTKEMTPEEVLGFTAKAKKSYDDYIAEAEAALKPPTP